MQGDDNESLETIFKYRVPESRARFVKELFIVLFMIFGFLLGILFLAFAQYYLVCEPKYPNITVMQCIQGNYAKRK